MNGRRDLGIARARSLLRRRFSGRRPGATFVLLDDYGYVVNNAHVRAGLSWDTVAWAFTSSEQYDWHPLTWLSHTADYWRSLN